MKKLMILAIALVTSIGFAQERSAKTEKEWNPEKMAQKKVEKMTSELNLTEAQQKQVYALYMEKSKERKSKMAKKDKSKAKTEKLSTERKEKMSEKHQAYSEKMKAILTPEQFAKWKESKSGDKSKRKFKKERK